MRIDRFLALRFSRRNLSPRSRVGMRIAVAGVALAVAIMLLAVSVVLGFKRGITRKIMGFDAQIVITDSSVSSSLSASEETDQFVRLTPPVASVISASVPSGASVCGTFCRAAILKTPEAFEGLVLKAFDDGYDYEFEKSLIVDGTEMFPDSIRYPIVLSTLTSRALSLGLGDKVDAFFQIGSGLKMRRFSVTALYDSNFSDFDKAIAFTDKEVLTSLLSIPDSCYSAIEIRGISAENPGPVLSSSALIEEALADAAQGGLIDRPLTVNNVYHKSVAYFAWLYLLDTNVWLIIILMAVVSGFTLVSSTFIIVLERVPTIGILKSLGATNSMISRTFLLVGLSIVIRGLVIGDIVALSFIVVQSMFHLLPLDPASYFLSYVPVRLDLISFLVINISTILFTLLLLLIPSRIVSRIPPSSVIDYE